jgi:diamine N-acetyltransferase
MKSLHEVPTHGAHVSLRPVTAQTVSQVCRLRVHPEQDVYVADNATSIAEAYFDSRPWFRAIYADETLVGFVMICDDADVPQYFLWRLMIDARYQGHGFGRDALKLVVDYVRRRPGAREFTTAYVPGERSPRDFYARFGFTETGREEHGQREMILSLR